MRGTTFNPVALAVCVGVPLWSRDAAAGQEQETLEMETNHGWSGSGDGDLLSSTASIKFLNQRNARAMVLEDQGLIVQGSLGLSLKVSHNVSIITGVWTDIHSFHPGPNAASFGAGTRDTGLDAFYEFDWWIGLSAKVGNLNVTAYYEEFLNPADDLASQTGGFESEHVQVVLTWDGLGDDLIEKVDLKPYVRFLIEADGKVGPGPEQGVYIELGVAPSFLISQTRNTPITLTTPVIVGLGADNFYEDDEVFGYVTIGAHASVPFRPVLEGQWTLTAGVDVVLGNDDAVGLFNSNVAGQSNDTQVIVSVSLGGSF